MTRIRHSSPSSFLLALTLGSSGGSCRDECPVGAETCPCSDIGACFEGLVCEEKKCVLPEGGTTGSESSSSETDSSSSSDVSTGSSSDVSTGSETGLDTSTGTGMGTDTSTGTDTETTTAAT